MHATAASTEPATCPPSRTLATAEPLSPSPPRDAAARHARTSRRRRASGGPPRRIAAAPPARGEVGWWTLPAATSGYGERLRARARVSECGRSARPIELDGPCAVGHRLAPVVVPPAD